MDFQVPGHPLVSVDCSSAGAGQLETKPINLKLIKGEPQQLIAQFNIPVSKNINVTLILSHVVLCYCF